MWMMVPAQGFVKKFFESITEYPYQSGSSLSVGNIGYQTLEIQKAKGNLQRLLDQAVQN
jgi:arylsulfatase